jgi:hypothetical protein
VVAPLPVPVTVPLPVNRPPGPAADDGHREPALATLPPASSDGWARGKFADFTHDELADMVRRCELRWQLPPFGGAAAGVAALGPEYQRVLGAERERWTAALRGLYADATGDRELAARLDLRALTDGVRRAAAEAADTGATTEVHLRLARAALAGDATTGESLYERFLQLQLGAGDRFEHALADVVGPERAHELRMAAGSRFTLTGCDADHALYRSER